MCENNYEILYRYGINGDASDSVRAYDIIFFALNILILLNELSDMRKSILHWGSFRLFV